MNKDNSKASFDGSSIKKGYKQILDENNEPLAYINKKELCSKSGKVVAKFVRYEKKGGIKCAIYKSDRGEYAFGRNELYFNNRTIGKAIKKKISFPYIIMLLCAVNVVLFVSIISINHMGNKMPTSAVLNIADTNGKWQTHGTIAVLDDTIHPDTNGEYSFTVTNENSYQIKFSFTINDLYNGQEVDNFPLLFRLKVGDTYLNTDWLTNDQLVANDIILNTNESQTFVLEWWWPFENGTDVTDTLYGIDNGKYLLILKLASQASGE